MSKRNLSQQTAERLYNSIVAEGTLRPGDKLPNEVELSQQLGVSRATLAGGHPRAGRPWSAGGPAGAGDLCVGGSGGHRGLRLLWAGAASGPAAGPV